jgi:hypothetical protein
MANDIMIEPKPVTVLLKSVELHTLPKIANAIDIRFSIYVNKTLVYAYKDQPKIPSKKRRSGHGMPTLPEEEAPTSTNEEGKCYQFILMY